MSCQNVFVNWFSPIFVAKNSIIWHPVCKGIVFTIMTIFTVCSQFTVKKVVVEEEVAEEEGLVVTKNCRHLQ